MGLYNVVNGVLNHLNGVQDVVNGVLNCHCEWNEVERGNLLMGSRKRDEIAAFLAMTETQWNAENCCGE